MAERTPNLVISNLSGPVTRDDVTVGSISTGLSTRRLGHSKSSTGGNVYRLGRSIPSDHDAYQEVPRTVAEEGMQTFLDNRKT